MSGWSVVRLREVADIAAGFTLGRKTKEAELIEVPYLRVANVQDGRLALSDVKTVAATRAEIEKWTLRDGDLMLTEGGDLDKLGRGACWREQLPVCIHQNHIFRVRLPSDLYDTDFVSLQVGSSYGKAYFLAHAKKTTGIASINQQVLGSFPLLSPHLTEQRQIAARLKAQLAEVEKARQAAQAQLRDIRLLRSRMLKEFFSELDAVPTKKLGDFARTTSGSTPSRGDKRYWKPVEIAWVKTGEVAFTPITATEEGISKVALAECSLSLLPPKTILIAMYGQGKTRGQSAVLEIPATTNQACFAILPNETWEPDFLHLWLKSSYQDLRDLSENRGGNQANLNGALLSALEIPAPDRNQQQQIVARIQSAMTEIDAIENSSKASLEDINRLPGRVLAQAFETQGHHHD